MPDETQTAVLLNGKPTVVFPSHPFRRACTKVYVNNPANGNATVYRGSPGGAFSVETSIVLGIGAATYTNPFNVPAGQGIYIVFNNSPNPVSNAYAKITCVKDN